MLLMVTRSGIYRYAGLEFCEQNPFVSFSDDFRLLQIGAANFYSDLYVVTTKSLYIKYPGLANAEVVDIG